MTMTPQAYPLWLAMTPMDSTGSDDTVAGLIIGWKHDPDPGDGEYAAVPIVAFTYEERVQTVEAANPKEMWFFGGSEADARAKATTYVEQELREKSRQSQQPTV